MNDLIVKNIQRISLDILRECLKIFDKYSLKYFALGGTALGAVRHEGFIPWDDDIDIGMPRPDYERFIEAAKHELPSPLFLQHYTTDFEYPLVYAKVRNSNTTFIETPLCKRRMNHGIFIDIFPLDGIIRKQKKKLLGRIAYKKVSSTFYSMKRNRIKEIIKYFPLKVVGLIFKDDNEIIRMLDNEIKEIGYYDSDYVANFYGAWHDKEIMPRNYFGIGVKKKFEDIYIVLPELYDLYLKQMYGDYMQPPPINKRFSQHNTVVIDINTPYSAFK